MQSFEDYEEAEGMDMTDGTAGGTAYRDMIIASHR